MKVEKSFKSNRVEGDFLEIRNRLVSDGWVLTGNDGKIMNATKKTHAIFGEMNIGAKRTLNWNIAVKKGNNSLSLELEFENILDWEIPRKKAEEKIDSLVAS